MTSQHHDASSGLDEPLDNTFELRVGQTLEKDLPSNDDFFRMANFAESIFSAKDSQSIPPVQPIPLTSSLFSATEPL